MTRSTFFLSLLTLLVSGTALRAEDGTKEVKIKTSAICEMCKARIERNLAYEKGVKESDLDVRSKVVTIRYNPKKTDVARLKANIAKTGYDAEELPADPAGYDKLPSCCKKTGHMNHQ